MKNKATGEEYIFDLALFLLQALGGVLTNRLRTPHLGLLTLWSAL